MASGTIRVGVIGAGANTRLHHIPKLQAIAGVEVVALVNRSRESSERVAKEFNIPQIRDSWREIIEDDSLDAVVIGTWPYMHRTMVLAALDAGKHVMTEARMAMNLDEAKEMLAASRAKPDSVAQIVPSPMTFHVDNLIMQKVAEGFIGDLLSVDLRVSQPAFIDPTGPLHWRHDRGFSGLNVMTMGIWYEATLRWTPGVNAVLSRTRTFVPMRKDESGLMKPATVPDHVEIIGDMPGGAVFHMQLSSVLGLTNGPEFWLYGTEGTLRYEGSSRTLFGGRRGDKALQPIDNPESGQYRWRVEEEFVGAIRGQEPITRTNFAEGVRYMAFTEAVARSAIEGRAIPILY